jgi:ABC-type antimicrobial peptide transport system permease subunit
MPPASLAPRLREIAAELDPELRVGSIETLDAVLREEQWILRVVALTLALVTLSVLLLSAAGIYALMSFIVAKRQREIGIRVALGAHPRRLLAAVFARALAQLGGGVAIGVVATMLLDLASGGELMGERGALWIPAVALLTAVVGALASVGPARRGLRVQPTDALRQE